MKYSVTAAAAALLSAAVFAGAGAALDPARVEVTGVTDRDPLSYRAGETIIFEIQTDYGGQKAEGDYFLAWERSGDDGRTERGRERVSAPRWAGPDSSASRRRCWTPAASRCRPATTGGSR